MALEDKKIPYEILIRFGDDGNPKGAHVQYRRVVVLNGETLKDEPLPAEPLGMVDFPLSEVMSDALSSALATVNRLEDEKQELLERVAGLLDDKVAILEGPGQQK